MSEGEPDLVEVGQAVGVLAEPLILSSESVSSSDLPELLQVHDVQSAADGQETLRKPQSVNKNLKQNVSPTPRRHLMWYLRPARWLAQ